MKKLRMGTKEWKEILFLDKRWPEYQGSKNPKTELMVSFASLGITIICLSVLGFFRNFPVITSSRCLELASNFNDWYCYDNTSSQPLDCKEYASRNESSNSSILQCYAFSLDIGRSSAVAFGLFKLFSLFIFGIVSLRKKFYWMVQKCKMPVACGVYCYSFTLLFTLLIIALGLFVYVFFVDISFCITGEYIYRIAFPIILIIFAVYVLNIPQLMHRYGVDMWSTYSYLATVDEVAETCIVSNPQLIAQVDDSHHPHKDTIVDEEKDDIVNEAKDDS